MTDQYQIMSVISAALRDVAGESGTTEPVLQVDNHEQAIPVAKAVLVALDKAGFEIVPKGEGG